MEERGTGILRMKAAMLRHGLDEPKLSIADGYFVVTLPGPGDDLERIRVPSTQGNQVIEQLSERQQKIIQQAVLAGSVTASWCVENLKVSRKTAFKDLRQLVELEFLRKVGVGRGTEYEPGATPQ